VLLITSDSVVTVDFKDVEARVPWPYQPEQLVSSGRSVRPAPVAGQVRGVGSNRGHHVLR
jgi:hypothetical protein